MITYPSTAQRKAWKPKVRTPKTVQGFPAKYAGTCIMCHEPILKGDFIRLFDTGKAYHVKCI